MYLKPTKRKRVRLRQKTILFIIIAAVAALGLFLLFRFLPISPFGKGLLTETGTSIPQTATANDKGILYLEEGSLKLISLDGSQIWNLPLDLPEAKVASSEDLICVYSGQSMQLLTFTKEPLYAKSLDSEIKKAACGKDHIAVLTTNAQGEQILSILGRKDEQVGQVDLASKEVVKFGFHGDSDSFWVLTLDTSGIVPTSYIATYKADGVQTNTIEINTQVVEDVFMTDSMIYASGTNSLASYTKFGEKKGEFLLYGWSPAAWNIAGESAVFAYTPNNSKHSIQSANLLFTDLPQKTISLPRSVFAVATTQTKLYAYTPTEVFIYNIDGSFSHSEKPEIELTAAKQISNNCVIVWDLAQKSHIMRLA